MKEQCLGSDGAQALEGMCQEWSEANWSGWWEEQSGLDRSGGGVRDGFIRFDWFYLRR